MFTKQNKSNTFAFFCTLLSFFKRKQMWLFFHFSFSDPWALLSWNHQRHMRHNGMEQRSRDMKESSLLPDSQINCSSRRPGGEALQGHFVNTSLSHIFPKLKKGKCLVPAWYFFSTEIGNTQQKANWKKNTWGSWGPIWPFWWWGEKSWIRVWKIQIIHWIILLIQIELPTTSQGFWF